MKYLIGFLFGILWAIGVAVTDGFWMMVFAFCIPPVGFVIGVGSIFELIVKLGACHGVG